MFRLAFLLLALTACAIPDARAQEKPKVEIVTQIRHTGVVGSIKFSADGRMLLSTSSDERIKLWDVATGRLLRTFAPSGSESVRAIAFAPDGRSLLVTGTDGKVRVLDLATGRVLRRFEGGKASRFDSATISGDGKAALIRAPDDKLSILDPATGRLLQTIQGQSLGRAEIAVSPAGRIILVDFGVFDGGVRLWDGRDGKLLREFKGLKDYETSLAFAADGAPILMNESKENETVKLWDALKGTLLQNFKGSFAVFSPDRRKLLVAGGDFESDVTLYDLANGKPLHSFKVEPAPNRGSRKPVFSPDGSSFVWGQDFYHLFELRNVNTGEMRTFAGHEDTVNTTAFSPDGRILASGSIDGKIKLWDPATGQLLRSLDGYADLVGTIAFAPDGHRLVSGDHDGKLALWDLSAGRLLRILSERAGSVTALAFSPDGSQILSGSFSGPLSLWDAATGQSLREFRSDWDSAETVAFSPDGRRALAGTRDNLQLWDLASGVLLRIFKGYDWTGGGVTFSPDGKRALAPGKEFTARMWDVESGKLLQTFKGHSGLVWSVAFLPGGRVLTSSQDGAKLWDAGNGKLLRSFKDYPGRAILAPGGRRVLTTGEMIKIWDLDTGALVDTFKATWDGSLAFSRDLQSMAWGQGAEWLAGDGTVHIWSRSKKAEVARLLSNAQGKWIAMTPEGFFASSHRDNDMLSIVRGLDLTTIGQVHQSLFNPDLVREALASDPNGEVKQAASVTNLDKVLDSGPPPRVEIVSHGRESKSETELVKFAARIKDGGKGIGRIEWRLNGITAGVANPPAGTAPVYEATQELALDPGQNIVEVVAYDARNILASLPAQATITFTGSTETVKPQLHVLAIGINSYVDKGWTPPGESVPLRFPKLQLAVGDAKELGAELEKASAGLYSKVDVKPVLNEEATIANLEVVITEMAARTHPRDTFVLFASAHGYSAKGRFYLIPQDYQGGNNPEALATLAIDQARLQDWIANRIKAKKVLILLDTCESGALTAGFARSRTDSPASEAGIGRLHEATGRPVLTAAAQGQEAYEGRISGSGEYRGIFTWALLDALRNGDKNGNGLIELSELVTHVQNVVPKIAEGIVQPVSVVQTPRFGSSGEDFAVVRRLQ